MKFQPCCKNVIYTFIILLTLAGLIYIRSTPNFSKFTILFPKKLDDVPRPDEKYLEFHNLSSIPSNITGLECIATKTAPSYDICIYPVNVDIYVSQSIKIRGMWEPETTKIMLEVFKLDPSSIFLDMGGNIGYYTLLAASTGHMVVTVEPNIENVKRIHMSVQKNNITSRVILLRNAVADERMFATVLKNNNNQGDTQIKTEMKECQGPCPPSVKTIITNDLAYLVHDLTLMSTNENKIYSGSSLYGRIMEFRKKHVQNKSEGSKSQMFKNPPANVIIKIDVQGFEHKAFHKPHIFFDVNRVTHIFMEWILMTQNYGRFNVESKIPRNDTHPEMEDPLKRDADKVNAMIRFFIERGITPYSITPPTSGQALDPKKWHQWPIDIVWCHYSNTKLALKSIV